MTSLAKKKTLLLLALLAFLLIGPTLLYPVFLAKVLCFALFAAAFNLLLGYVGLLSFGHAAFFGMAAYVSGYTMTTWGTTPEVAILLGTAVGAMLGLVFGFLAIRRKGIYFAMITLALAQMVYFFCLQSPFTGGEDGLQGISRAPVFGFIDISSSLAIYYFVLVIFLIGMGIIYRTIYSPFGQVLDAIRENEDRAISLGYDTDRYKLLAFVISAALSGLAGSTKIFIFQLASLTDVQWQMSGEVILMTLLGGMGTMLGPIVGASIVVSMQNYLAGMGSMVTIIQGVIFVICVMMFRKGVVGEIAGYIEKRRLRAK
ncbi:branched-chain amino acid ABC transporter permease [Fodinicurvata halophila]|uniref:Branched-chain amino acid ABC transporter permease n=1 Tax=Fodinicurvata halophila TaxID=1419723 RepID=A0ABV8URU4_9PROT